MTVKQGWSLRRWKCCLAVAAAAAAKSLQSHPTLCDPIDGSPPGSPIPGILQARTLEWVAISFSNARKWKWSRSVVSNSLWPHGLQPTRLLHPWDFPGKSTGVGCHCLLRNGHLGVNNNEDSHSSPPREASFAAKEIRAFKGQERARVAKEGT